MTKRRFKRSQVFHHMPGEIFHVHTKRCGHAGDEDDHMYVEKAIKLGAPKIVFTDHAPFPGNPFENRMDMEELDEYVESISRLSVEYDSYIDVKCGLEIEYIRRFEAYYEKLRDDNRIDLLVLGQHFFEHVQGGYSFLDDDKKKEYSGLCQAMVEGINTGLFDVVAHPDRAFRRQKNFGRSEIECAKSVIWAAAWQGVYLEKNWSSMQKKGQYWEEFWELLPPKAMTIYGIDAHSTKELEEGYARIMEATDGV